MGQKHLISGVKGHYGRPAGVAKRPPPFAESDFLSVWRQGFVLALWELDLDGGCAWFYRHSFGSPWDDFANPAGTYRDFMMTYPAADRPIPTVQWVAYREGNDDLRYLATLEKRYEAAARAGTHAEARAAVDAWRERRFDRPSYGDNLDAVRERVIGHILALE